MLSEKKTRVFSGIFFFLTCIFHTDQNDTEWTCLYTLWFTPNIFVQSGICGAHIHHHHSPSLLSVMACLCQWSTKLSWSTITYHLIGYGCCTIFFLNLTLTFSFSISLFFFFPPLLFQFIFFSFSFSFRNWHRQSPAPSKYVQKRLRQGLYRVLYHTSHYNMHNVFFKFLCDASLYHFFFFFTIDNRRPETRITFVAHVKNYTSRLFLQSILLPSSHTHIKYIIVVPIST